MPLTLPDRLPAIEILKNEGIAVGIVPPSERDTVPPLRIALLNLMPLKEATETDFVRVLSTSPLHIELCLMRLDTHKPKHASEEHMKAFYRGFGEMRDERFDGMIITGAPVEQLEFEDVSYWRELTEIFDWTRAHVRSTLYICWAAQAGLYYHYGIRKYPLPRKMFGIFPQSILKPRLELFRGFDDTFCMPHSRHAEVRKSDIEACPGLVLLAESPVSGVSMVMSRHRSEFFVTGHMEYSPHTLHNEYVRDHGKRDDVGLPVNYYRDDDPTKQPVVSWRAHATLVYNNWINNYCRELRIES